MLSRRSQKKFSRKVSLQQSVYSKAEIFVDNFAGGGGASTGIEIAIGRSVDEAINHDPAAIAMHEANHPETRHWCESVWDKNPAEVAAGRPVALAWFSPDCKHFSKAKGAKPVNKAIRGLAWVAVRWAAIVRPRVIMLENVEEFQTWGPVIPKRDPKTGRMLKLTDRTEETENAIHDVIEVAEEGEFVPFDKRIMIPDPENKGRTFKSFVNALKRYGYEVEWRELKACDYGAPTSRNRLFLIARCDGKPIVWPEPTHGKEGSGLLPYKTAADIIDWSIPTKSIFNRKKELADNTKRRIARGIMKHVINSPNPFIVRIGQTGFGGDRLQYSIDQPLTTITTKAEHLLVAPTLIQMGYTERKGQKPRVLELDQPVGTVTAGGNKFAIAAAALIKHYGGNYKGAGNRAEDPLSTITTIDHHALVTATIENSSVGRHEEVKAFLIAYYGCSVGQSLNEPLQTVVTKDRFGLVTIHGVDYQIVDIGMRMLEPHELYAAQGFPIYYIIDGYLVNDKPVSKADQVARCGNSVSPVMSKVLVQANLPEHCVGSGKVLAFERYKEPVYGQLQLSI